MKANKLFFYTIASLLSVQSMSPDFTVNVQSSHGRMPASATTTTKKKVVKKAIAKKPVTSKEMKALQEKLAQLESTLKNKENMLDQKTKELELFKNNKTDEKIDALTKLIAEQKSDIDKLRNDIKNSEIKDVKIVNQSKLAVEVVVCKSESKGEKLEADVKNLLNDKEDVLKRIAGLTKENDDLKLKLSAKSEPKKEEVAKVEVTKDEIAKVEIAKKEEDKAPAAKKSLVPEKKSENLEAMALMSQLTTMFTAQMQSQMQMQMQMMNMLSQMQNNMMPQLNPYSPSLYSPTYSQGYPTLSNSIGSLGMGVGIPAQSSPWSDYSNPYSMIPSMQRQQVYAPAEFAFPMNQNPAVIRGFDFIQTPDEQMQKHQLVKI